MKRATIAFIAALPISLSAFQISDANQIFVTHCVVCHGDKGAGTDRGPALTNSRRLRQRTKAEIASVIKNGLPPGMPAVALSESELTALSGFVATFNSPASELKLEGDAQAGEQFFFGKGRCSTCHMVRGRGTVNGPDLSEIGRQSTLAELQRSLTDPSAQLTPGYVTATVHLRNGTELSGLLRSEGSHSIALQTSNGRIHLILEGEYRTVVRNKTSSMPALKSNDGECRDLLKYLAGLAEAPSGAITAAEPVPESAIQAILHPEPNDWVTYHGSLSGNRYRTLKQINKTTVRGLTSQWISTLPASELEMTPIVIDGVMYVTGPNQVLALDGRTGQQIWRYARPRTLSGIAGDALKGINRGVAALGDRIFYVTDNAHLLCLHRLTGALLWDVTMADQPGHYGATSAPLVAENLVISGVAGGDEGIRGFIDAYDAATGRRVWRF